MSQTIELEKFFRALAQLPDEMRKAFVKKELEALSGIHAKETDTLKEQRLTSFLQGGKQSLPNNLKREFEKGEKDVSGKEDSIPTPRRS